jgi:hypothetical protein
MGSPGPNKSDFAGGPRPQGTTAPKGPSPSALENGGDPADGSAGESGAPSAAKKAPRTKSPRAPRERRAKEEEVDETPPPESQFPFGLPFGFPRMGNFGPNSLDGADADMDDSNEGFHERVRERAREKREKAADALLASADRMFEQGNVAGAKRKYKEITKKYKDTAAAADAAVKLGDLECMSP